MKTLLIYLATIGFGVQANAGILGNSFFLEPYLGYKTENSKLTDLVGNTLEIKTAVPNLGLKMGFRSMVGIDFNLYGDISQGKADISTLPEKNNFSKKSAGVQLGVNSLGFAKMYLGTSFLNDFTIEESSQMAALTLSGPSYHAGIILKAFPIVNLGLQYNLNQYNKITGANFTAGDKLDTYYSKVDTQDYSIYLSATF